MASVADDIVIEMTDRSRGHVTWRLLISDFANMLKAFMGANYLNVAYAFTQSGLVPGILCLILIASVTDHCCHLIVKCKYHGINSVIRRQKMKYSNGFGSGTDESSDNEESDHLRGIRTHMLKNLTYGDVGNIAYGTKGQLLVNTCILFTQFGFCVSYFIFVGNTLNSLFPCSNSSVIADNTSEEVTIIPATSTIAPNYSSSEDAVLDSINFTQAGNYSQAKLTEAMTSIFDDVFTTTISYTNLSNFVEETNAPDLRLLVISPLPIFMGFAFMRSVRAMGIVSIAADVAIFVGCIVTMLYLIIGFTPSSTWHLFEWSSLSIFFGMVTSSFEGIGTIIPIESSMEGNRHNFNKFLHGAVGILAFVLLLFGTMGYLRYGHETEQMLNANMPHGTIIGTSINICLCIGVILTFPLQMYPVIELLEIFIFSEGKVCGPKRKRLSRRIRNDDDDDDDDDNGDLSTGMNSAATDKDLLIPKDDTEMPLAVAARISDEVPTWKRNVLRVVSVLAAGGLAILLRDLYAYVGAFIGALGSSLLAYIIPCLFHLKLSWHITPLGVKIKDIIIIIFGAGASIVSLYSTIYKVIKAF